MKWQIAEEINKPGMYLMKDRCGTLGDCSFTYIDYVDGELRLGVWSQIEAARYPEQYPFVKPSAYKRKSGRVIPTPEILNFKFFGPVPEDG